MIIISEKKHISTIISSINKVYNRAKINGKLSVKDIYYLHVIYKLLTNDLFDLTLDENNVLVTTYNRLAYLSKDICPPIILKTYQTTPKITFEQAGVKDCNNYNSFKKIFYWQEEFNKTQLDILGSLDFNYLDNKPSDSYENFEIGKDINLNDIGYLSFFLLGSLESESYIIKDALNNDVTHAFTSFYNNTLKGYLFISNNKYTHSLINLKIIKQTQQLNIFNNVFNNIFM